MGSSCELLLNYLFILCYRILHTTVGGTETEITSAADSRYTLSGGRLVITDPVESKDAGTYQCVAQNELGMTLSDMANITFGGNITGLPVSLIIIQKTILPL